MHKISHQATKHYSNLYRIPIINALCLIEQDCSPAKYEKRPEDFVKNLQHANNTDAKNVG